MMILLVNRSLLKYRLLSTVVNYQWRLQLVTKRLGKGHELKTPQRKYRETRILELFKSKFRKSANLAS